MKKIVVVATLLGHALLSDIRPWPSNRGFTAVIKLLTPSENSTALPLLIHTPIVEYKTNRGIEIWKKHRIQGPRTLFIRMEGG